MEAFVLFAQQLQVDKGKTRQTMCVIRAQPSKGAMMHFFFSPLVDGIISFKPYIW